MANIFRTRVALTNFPGAPGVSTMYFRDVATAVDSLETLWTGIATLMPDDVHIQVEGFGDVINDANGDLVDSWTGTEPAPLIGTATGSYSAPTGILLRWTTNTIVDSHRLRGRTFVVPADGAVFSSSGQVTPANVEGIQTLMSAFIVAQNASFCIWHRPKFGPAPTPGAPRPVIRNGSNGLVTGSGISTKAVVLRSRRD